MPRISTLLLTALTLLPFIMRPQDVSRTPLQHEMSSEERALWENYNRDFYPTDPPEGPVRMVAEFEQMQAVLVRSPFGIPMTLVAEMSEDCHVLTIVANASQQQQVVNQYQSNGVNLDNCEWLFAPTDSYWTRDYGPWFVVDGNNEVGICNFPYNRPRPNDNDIPIAVANYLGIELYGMDLSHTGGNWMCDGWLNGASTDLVWEENPSLSHDDIDNLVESYLGIERHHVLPDPLDEYIKHIDCWGKFLDVDKVLIGQVPEWDYRYDDFEYVANYFALRTSAWGNLYQVYRVFTPGDYPYTPYTNSLILNKKVFVPITGSQYDSDALAVYEEAMPGYEVVGIMYNTWENTDALHCRAKGIADVGMLYIRHKPLLGNKNFQLHYTVETEIIPYSGSGLKPDSSLVYYMIDSTSYEVMELEHESGTTYSATFPFMEPGTQVAYYLHAADFSGRRMEHPYIGQPDAHTFTVNYAGDAVTLPGTLEYTTFDQCTYGQTFDIYNFTNGDLVIESMETEHLDLPFEWHVADPPSFPHTMAYGDTLQIRVLVFPPIGLPEGWAIDTLTFATAGGNHDIILKVDEDLLTGIGDNAIASAEVNVYPNPFNASTFIDIELEKQEEVIVDILTLDGRVIKTLSQSTLPEGNHRITWNASGFPDGIYLVRLNIGDEVILKKIVKMNP